MIFVLKYLFCGDVVYQIYYRLIKTACVLYHMTKSVAGSFGVFSLGILSWS